MNCQTKGERGLKTCVYSRDAYVHRSFPYIALFFVLLTGSLLGTLCAKETSTISTTLMRGCIASSVSIVSLVYSLLLPYLAVLLAAIYSNSFALFPICFIKFFSFSFMLMGLRLAFGPAGWLMCVLLMLSNSVSVVFLVCLCFRNIRGFRPSVYWDIEKRMITILGISLLDYHFIAPYLAQIIVR
jgi:hypothetical protein